MRKRKVAAAIPTPPGVTFDGPAYLHQRSILPPEVNVCRCCSLSGYEYADTERELCHNCVTLIDGGNEKSKDEVAALETTAKEQNEASKADVYVRLLPGNDDFPFCHGCALAGRTMDAREHPDHFPPHSPRQPLKGCFEMRGRRDHNAYFFCPACVQTEILCYLFFGETVEYKGGSLSLPIPLGGIVPFQEHVEDAPLAGYHARFSRFSAAMYEMANALLVVHSVFGHLENDQMATDHPREYGAIIRVRTALESARLIARKGGSA